MMMIILWIVSLDSSEASFCDNWNDRVRFGSTGCCNSLRLDRSCGTVVEVVVVVVVVVAMAVVPMVSTNKNKANDSPETRPLDVRKRVAVVVVLLPVQVVIVVAMEGLPRGWRTTLFLLFQKLLYLPNSLEGLVGEIK